MSHRLLPPVPEARASRVHYELRSRAKRVRHFIRQHNDVHDDLEIWQQSPGMPIGAPIRRLGGSTIPTIKRESIANLWAKALVLWRRRLNCCASSGFLLAAAVRCFCGPES